MNHMDPNLNCSCEYCRNELNLDKLCVRKLKACKIKVRDLDLEGQLCAPLFSGPSACLSQITSDRADFNNACLGNLSANIACVQNLNTPNANLGNVVANNLCVPGELKAKIKVCSQYEATAVYSALTTYNLGDLLNFNLILSNASGALTSSPTSYTAKVAGNYIVMFQIDQQNLVPTPAFGPILGVPVANPQIILNGVIHREQYSSYLTFFNQQRSTMTALVRLAVGDVMQFKYKVLAVNQASGITEIAGTVDILGNGSTNDQSVVKVELISVDCANEPVSCLPVIPCAPCTPKQCVPCTPDGSEPCVPKDKNLPAPMLNPIILNPGSLNSYVVSWSSVNSATGYTLEVSQSANFANPMIVFSGSNVLSFGVNFQVSGTYYYRVFASNTKSNSPYSNIRSIVII